MLGQGRQERFISAFSTPFHMCPVWLRCWRVRPKCSGKPVLAFEEPGFSSCRIRYSVIDVYTTATAYRKTPNPVLIVAVSPVANSRNEHENNLCRTGRSIRNNEQKCMPFVRRVAGTQKCDVSKLVEKNTSGPSIRFRQISNRHRKSVTGWMKNTKNR